MEPPVVFGAVRLGGADTCLVHMLSEVDLENLKIGMRLEAVFESDRKTNILDVKHFRRLRQDTGLTSNQNERR